MKRITKILAVCMLVVMVAMTFASCGIFSLNFEKVEARLEKKGYEVFTRERDGRQDLVAWGDDENFINASTFATNDEAKEYYSDLKNDWEDLSEEYKEKGLKVTYGKSGKTLYFGTVDAVKTALGFPSSLFVFAK